MSGLPMFSNQWDAILVGYLGGEITTSLELFEEGRQEEGREEQDSRPEENVWGVGAMGATCRPNKMAL